MGIDFDQLAFIEKWRRNASRGIVVALDGTRGDLLVTLRVGELGERLDLRGRDATGAVRKARLTIGDRATLAIEYAASEVGSGAAGGVLFGQTVARGAQVEGAVASVGEAVIVDLGVAPIIVRADTLPDARVGDVVRFTIADEGKAYYIPTR